MRRHLPPAILLIVILLVPSDVRSQVPPRPWTGADIQKAISHLDVVGTVLYVAAHPDDENTAFLATMVNGYGVRTGYLALTRGEGGQNLIGPEQDALLGLIRARELLAARRIDGAEQFFTRAIDFGYSKTSEETLRLWGRDQVLSDIVYVIRSFRPDVIVTRFTPDRGGHGNHTASAILALEAARAAGDPSRFQEQFTAVSAWKPVRVVWNAFRFGQSPPDEEEPNDVIIDLGAYDPLLGVSYAELAGKARSMHKSQGFGASQYRGSYTNAFRYIQGEEARNGLFDGIDMTWGRIPGAMHIPGIIDSLKRNYRAGSPSASIPSLLRLRTAMSALTQDPMVLRKLEMVNELILACAGVWVDALSDRGTYVRGDTMHVTLQVINRSDIVVRLGSWSLGNAGPGADQRTLLRTNEPFDSTLDTRVSATEPYSQEPWLRKRPADFSYTVDDNREAVLPEGQAARVASVVLLINGVEVRVERPVRFRRVDPVNGELYEPVRIVPRVTGTFADKAIMIPGEGPKRVSLRIKAFAPVRRYLLGLDLPDGWSADPEGTLIEGLMPLEERTVDVRITRTPDAPRGEARITGDADGEPVAWALRDVSYDHIPPVALLEPSSAMLVPLTLNGTSGKIGYIMGAGDDLPVGLKQLGYDVELLSDDDLVGRDLSVYPAIVAGVRAYNTRPILGAAADVLRAYMEAGGVYIMQYLTTGRGGATTIGPYPLTIGRDRVTDEHAPMRLLQPDHPVFTMPNRIGPDDFQGWVQERGLYFAESWDTAYTPLIGCSDPGETETKGGLLIARVGKGAFIYTGLSFFRQIPAGVPGAYRLLENLISYRPDR